MYTQFYFNFLTKYTQFFYTHIYSRTVPSVHFHASMLRHDFDTTRLDKKEEKKGPIDKRANSRHEKTKTGK